MMLIFAIHETSSFKPRQLTSIQLKSSPSHVERNEEDDNMTSIKYPRNSHKTMLNIYPTQNQLKLPRHEMGLTKSHIFPVKQKKNKVKKGLFRLISETLFENCYPNPAMP